MLISSSMFIAQPAFQDVTFKFPQAARWSRHGWQELGCSHHRPHPLPCNHHHLDRPFPTTPTWRLRVAIYTTRFLRATQIIEVLITPRRPLGSEVRQARAALISTSPLPSLRNHPLQMAQPWDYIAKIVSLGDSGCGKSSVRSKSLQHHRVVLTGL